MSVWRRVCATQSPKVPLGEKSGCPYSSCGVWGGAGGLKIEAIGRGGQEKQPRWVAWTLGGKKNDAHTTVAGMDIQIRDE